MITKQVLIIGGGCAGLWLAHELSNSGVKTGVIDSEPYASYATTRNQGWLQSGAFYAARDDMDAALACARGFSLTKQFAPEAVLENMPAFFLFEEEVQLQEALIRCASLGIYATAIPYLELENNVPILSPGNQNFYPFRFAARVHDCPVDTHLLMRKIAERAASKGVQFFLTPKLETISFKYQRDHWLVYPNDSIEIACDIVVLTCGASTPKMLRRLVSRESDLPSFALTKIPVLVVHGEGFNSLLATPHVHGGPSVVPFQSSDGSGATICIGRADQNVQSHDDIELPADCFRAHIKCLRDWLPGINSIISENKITAHFYVCQKLQLGEGFDPRDFSRTHILFDHSPQPDAPNSILTLYPGKMTAALPAAEECRRKIMGILQGSSTENTIESWPMIAKQPYYLSPSHSLALRDGLLEFESLYPDSD